MMLHRYCSKDLGHNDFNNPSKLHNFLSPLKPSTWVFLAFNGLNTRTLPKSLRFIDSLQSRRANQRRSSSGSRVLGGFKLHCVSNTPVSPSKASVLFNRKKNKHRGALPLVLWSLEYEGDVEKALSSYVGRLHPKDQTAILKELGSWEKVVRVFNWMRSQKDYVPNVIHYNVVLKMLCQAQRWDEFRLCWIEMAKDGVLPTYRTYNMLISEYGKAGLVSESLLWIKHMRVQGIFPDEVTLSMIVKVLKDAEEFDRADRFYKDWCVGKVDIKSLGLNDMNEFGSESHPKPISFKHFLSTELFEIGGRNTASDAVVLSEMENVVRKPQQTATYNTLIDLYGKAGRLINAAEVFAEMLKSGVAPDTITFNTMIHIYGSHAHLTKAEALLNKMEKMGVSPDTRTYTTLLSLYAEAGNVDAALLWYRKIRDAGLFPDEVTYGAVLNMLCETQMVQEAESVLTEMEKCNVKVHELSVPRIIKMYVTRGLLDQARIVFEKCQANGGFSSKTYAAIMDKYAEKGLCAEAEAVFYAKRDPGGKKKDVLEYNVMIKALGMGKHYERAFSMFKGMRNSGTWPDECTYNSLIQMFAGGDLVDQAKEVLNEMQEVGLRPHCQTYSAMIAGYVRQGLLSDAINTFKEMEKVGLKANAVVYGALINGFANTGRTDEALHYYRKMEDEGITANQIVLTSLMKLSKGGNLENAKDIYEYFKGMRNSGTWPDEGAYNSLIQMFAGGDLVDQAKEVLNEMQEVGLRPHCHTYSAMIAGYVRQGLLSDAINTFKEMEKVGLKANEVVYGALINGFANTGRSEEALHYYRKMEDEGIRANQIVLTSLMKLSKGGNLEKAKEIYENLKRFEGGPDIVASNTMFSLYAYFGVVSEARVLFDNLRQKGHADGITYTRMMDLYMGMGMLDEAAEVAEEMKQSGLLTDCASFSKLIACYVRQGLLSDAINTFKQMEKVGLKANEVVYGALINGFANTGRTEEALQYYRKMEAEGITANQIVLTSLMKLGKGGNLEKAQGIYEYLKTFEGGPDIVASNTMISLYAYFGIVSGAKVLFDNLRQKGHADGITYARMMDLYTGMGMFDEAAEVAEEMKQSGLLKDCTSFSNVMACYATNGRLKDCGELLREMITRKILPDNSTLKVLFTVLKKGGIPSEAVQQLLTSYHEAKPYALQAIITCVFSAVGLHACALQSCETFIKRGIHLDPFAYNVAIYTYGACGQTENALNMFMRMRDVGFEPDIVTDLYLVDCYGRANMVEGIKQIFGRMKYHEIEANESLYKAIVKAYRNANRPKLAELVSQQMRFRFGSDEYCESDIEEGESAEFGEET